MIMQRHKLPNIPFARPGTFVPAAAFLQKHGKVIIKPLKGSGAHDIRLISNASELEGIDISKYLFEKYVPGKEMRYLVLNGAVIAVHESEYGASVAADRALKRISYTQSGWDPALTAMSVRIASILGLQFAAVDYIVDAKTKAHILEVNSTPGIKWFHAPTSGPPVDVAGMFLTAIIESTRLGSFAPASV
jgi:glutathione synthase/RimK-type ligase-like ATP-grasp enzyme